MEKLFEQLILDGYDIDTIQKALDAFKEKDKKRKISEARQFLGEALLEYACALKLISPEEATRYDLNKLYNDLRALEPTFLRFFTPPPEKIVSEPVAHAEEAVRTLDDNQILAHWLAGL
jgi:hypothetical protein